MDRIPLLARYRRGYREVMEALAGMSPAELDESPGEDSWTPRQVIHHLADSETTAYVRLRKLLAEENPLLQGYDEVEFAKRLHYERPVEASLAVLQAVREASAELLEALDPEEWKRLGSHSESGPYSVDRWLEIYAAHAHDHADQIRRARRGEG